MRLEAAGIPAYVQDENMVQLDWLKANMIGGARVQIAEEDVEAARELLAQERGGSGFKPALVCPKCGSTHVARQPIPARTAYISILLFGIPLLWLRRSLRCEECLHTWKQGEEH